DRGLDPPVRLEDADVRRRRVHDPDRAASGMDRLGRLRRGEGVVRGPAPEGPRDVAGVARAPRPTRGRGVPPAAELRGVPPERDVCVLSDEKAIRPRTRSEGGMDRIRAITFDAFGTIIDTGREALIRISDRIVRDQFLDVGPAGFLERWDVHFFWIDHDPFLTLAEASEVLLARAFR